MKTAVIILHFGKLTTTQACLKSIAKVEKKVDGVIVVNNDQIILKQNDFPASLPIVIISNKKNVGFAQGVNIGIAYALKKGFDSVLLLNNDTVLTVPIIAELKKDFIEDKKIGIAAPAIEFSKNGKLFYDLGGYITAFGKTKHENVKKIPFEILHVPHYVSGCCMMIRKEVFEKIGYFDKQFFLYYEDVDFCLRAKKAGFAVVMDPKVVLHHELSKAAGQGSKIAWYHQTKSALLFGKKYYGKSWKRILNMLFITAQSILFLKKNPKNGIFAFAAMKDVFLGG